MASKQLKDVRPIVDAILKERKRMSVTDAEGNPFRYGEAFRGGLRYALRIIEQAPVESAAPGWVSVKDRLPGETGSYIICTANHAVCTARYYAKSGLFNGVAGRHAAYWMPLPEPPKEG